MRPLSQPFQDVVSKSSIGHLIRSQNILHDLAKNPRILSTSCQSINGLAAHRQTLRDEAWADPNSAHQGQQPCATPTLNRQSSDAFRPQRDRSGAIRIHHRRLIVEPLSLPINAFNFHKAARVAKSGSKRRALKRVITWLQRVARKPESFFCYPLVMQYKEKMEPLVGIEPTTYSLRMNCSTPELQRR